MTGNPFVAAPIYDWYETGFRHIVLRPHGTHLCAYIGIPADHPLAGYDYEELPSLDVHGGLTFAGKLPGLSGWWFYGWDYAHIGDEGKWTPEDVKEHAARAAYEFAKLARLSEKIRGATA